MPTPSNVTITGGSTAQQQAILTAHTAALSALQTAQTQASSGAGAFATWFGATGASVQSTVSSNYSTAVNALQSWTFTYDLDNAIFDLTIAPGIFLIFVAGQPTQISAALWRGFWDYSAIDPTRSPGALASSVAHQALSLATGNTVYDVFGAIDVDGASLFATSDAPAAPNSLRNYLFYASLPSGGAIVPSSTASTLRLAPRLDGRKR